MKLRVSNLRILNLGCGQSKITGATNVDMNSITKCELVFDIKKPFPLANKSYDKVCLFHCIEHIEKQYHFSVFKEIHRVLDDNGTLLIAYPEFSVILQNWIDNRNMNREFWEATIYGRQAYEGDYHYCGIHTPNLIEELKSIGFTVARFGAEPTQPHNTVMMCEKSEPLPTYEEVLYREVFER
jgi:SAM-dependent methyltransferase